MPSVWVKKEYGLVVLGEGKLVNVRLRWASFLEAECSSSLGECFLRNGEGCYLKESCNQPHKEDHLFCFANHHSSSFGEFGVSWIRACWLGHLSLSLTAFRSLL